MQAPAAMPRVEFWFEFASTYSYPAAMRIAQAARANGVAVVWKAFLLGPLFKAQGWSDSPFNLYPAKGRYMWRDLERVCEELGLHFARPSQFPRNGLLAARVACAFSEATWLPDFVRAVYTANFAEDRDIGDAAVVADCLEHAAQAPAPILALAQTDESKGRLRERTQQAERLGIFGAPSFVTGGELFWGNDRLEAALRAAARRDHGRPGGMP
jgi:2-hydroxychromene-2-carboxylate isomerase